MISVRSFLLPPVNRREIMRYAGVKTETPELSALLEEALSEAVPLLAGKACWSEFPAAKDGKMLNLGFTGTASESLQKHLTGCDRIVVFAATLGLGLDRLIAKYGLLSPAKMLMLQAIGAERIEALCDAVCESIRQEAAGDGRYPVTRFSPGYDDLPLDVQTDIFRVLDCSRKIGLTLNGSLLMSPSKSVTAIVGLSPCAGSNHNNSCSRCGKTDCLYRRTTP